MQPFNEGRSKNRNRVLALAAMGALLGAGIGPRALAAASATGSTSVNNQTAEETWKPAGTDVSGTNDPWTEMQQFQARMDQMFANAFNEGAMLNNKMDSTVPNMNLRDEKDHYEVTMNLPGADKEKIKVNVEGRFLSVSGQQKTNQEMKNDGKVVGDEQSLSQFERTITLPGPVRVAAIDAKYNNGILTIDLPKAGTSPEPTSVPVH
jgi:HSP20 family protein